MFSDDLESKIVSALRGLSYAGVPVKARTVAQILSDQAGIPINKRQISPILYRMRAEGKVTRDEYFRWSLKGADRIGPRTLNVQGVPSAPSSIKAADAAKIYSSPVPIPVKASTTPDPHSQPQQSSHFETVRYGPFEIMNEARPNARHCRWCSEQIPAKLSSPTVRLKGNVMFFCRVDCWQNWESIYWQRAALKRLHLSACQFRREQRRITRQKRFLGYRLA